MLAVEHPNQWHRNEFENVAGGHTSVAKRGKKISSCPAPFGYASRLLLVVLVSAFVMVSIQFGQFLVCCSTHGAPRAQSFVKVGARAPMPYGVGATDPNYFVEIIGL